MTLEHPQSGRNFLGPRNIGARIEDYERRKGVQKSMRKKAGLNHEVGANAGYETLTDKKSVQKGRRGKIALKETLLNPAQRDGFTGMAQAKTEVTFTMTPVVTYALDKTLQERLVVAARREYGAEFERAERISRTRAERSEKLDDLSDQVNGIRGRRQAKAALSRLCR